MPDSKKVILIGPAGKTFAEVMIVDEDEGWFTGRVISQSFPSDVGLGAASCGDC